MSIGMSAALCNARLSAITMAAGANAKLSIGTESSSCRKSARSADRRRC